MKNETPFLKVTIDVDEPLPEIRVPAGHYGVGVFLRRDGKPIGYFHHRAEPERVINPAELASLVMLKAGRDIVRSGLWRPDRSTPHAKPTLTVAICTKDRAWSLDICLRSLEPLQFSGDSKEPRFEILVVDNAPSDSSTKDLVTSKLAVDYVVEPMAGLDFARNTAVRQARGEYLAFLDDDVAVDAAWFRGLVRAVSENPGAGGITGPVMPMELATYAQVLFEERGGFSRGFGTVRHTQHTVGTFTHPCNAGKFGAGCNMVFRRELLLKMGLFDEALDTGKPLPGGGDLDIFYRVLRAGQPLIYEAEMAVYHRHRSDYAGLRRQMWTWGLGVMAFAMKTYGSDPSTRFRVRMMIFGAFVYLSRLAVLSKLGRNSHEWTLDLALWEIVGGMQGLAGEYGRSRKRIDAIRRAHA